MTGDNWYDYYSCLYEPDAGPPRARKSRNANDAAGERWLPEKDVRN